MNIGSSKRRDYSDPYFILVADLFFKIPIEEVPKYINHPIVNVLARKRLEGPEAISKCSKLIKNMLEIQDNLNLSREGLNKIRTDAAEAYRELEIFFEGDRKIQDEDVEKNEMPSTYKTLGGV